MKTYKAKEIEELARISRMQLQHWVSLGIIRPHVDTRGRGKSRTYSQLNLIEAMICRELNLFGMEATQMSVVLKGLRLPRFWEHYPSAEVFLVVTPEDPTTVPPSLGYCGDPLGLSGIIRY